MGWAGRHEGTIRSLRIYAFRGLRDCGSRSVDEPSCFLHYTGSKCPVNYRQGFSTWYYHLGNFNEACVIASKPWLRNACVLYQVIVSV